MNVDSIRKVASDLLDRPLSEYRDRDAGIAQVVSGTLSLTMVCYGKNAQYEELQKALGSLRGPPHARSSYSALGLAQGILSSLIEELDAGLIGSVEAQVAGEVLGDMIALAREVLRSKKRDSVNVASVLSAAAFEDAIRRMGVSAGRDPGSSRPPGSHH